MPTPYESAPANSRYQGQSNKQSISHFGAQEATKAPAPAATSQAPWQQQGQQGHRAQQQAKFTGNASSISFGDDSTPVSVAPVAARQPLRPAAQNAAVPVAVEVTAKSVHATGVSSVKLHAPPGGKSNLSLGWA
jgi:hypothetical protein